MPLLLGGCVAGGSSGDGPARKVAADFFALLASGDTDAIAAIISPDSTLVPAVLDKEFYASTIARPTDAEVVEALETEPGTTYVTVDYSIEGEDRSIKVAVVEVDGEARISGWLDETLSVGPLRAPGGFEVNGSLTVGELEESIQFVALPGVYSFEYVDPKGFGTPDPDGAETESFAVEFPVEGPQLVDTVPPGVKALGSGISVEPRLLSSVEDEVTRQLAQLVKDCSASALTGDDCPARLVTEAAEGGAVDRTSIIWTADTKQVSVPSEEWSFVADYSVAFNRVSAGGRTTLDARYEGVVVPDALGKPVLEVAR